MTQLSQRREADPKFERFIPPEIAAALLELQRTQGWTTTRLYNQWLETNHPTVPRSSRTRWTRAFLSGAYHSDTPDWHVRYREDASIIPDDYSAIRSGEFRHHYEQWQKDGEIRYVNIGCFHRPFDDPAVWNLARQIIYRFDPNVFPVMSDTLDNNLLNQHKPKPETQRVRVLDERIYQEHARNRYAEFRWLSQRFIDDVREVVRPTCSLINLWGNHEHWLLRQMLDTALVQNDPDLADEIIRSIFDVFQTAGVLWVEADRRQWTPLIKDRFWVGHGTLARSGEGLTARAYLQQLKYAVSIAVSHNHRMEEIMPETPLGPRLAAVAGTMGPKLRGYNKSAWVGHSWGFHTIIHPTASSRGLSVEPVRVSLQDGYYVARWRGEEFSERATVTYDDLFDYGI